VPYKTTDIIELRRQRKKLGEDMRALHDKAAEESRALSAEEGQSFDRMYDKAEELRQQIERMEKLDGLTEDLEKPAGRSAGAPDPNEIEPEHAEDAAREMRTAGRGPRDTPEYRNLFDEFLQAPNSTTAMVIQIRAHEYLQGHEQRDLQTDVDEQAGYLVPPEQFVMELLKELDDETFLSTWARNYTVRQSKSLGAVKRTSKASTWTWGAEIATPTKDTSLKFGKRVLFPHHASGEIDVSRDLMRSSIMGPEQIVRAEIARDGAELFENAILTGSGVEQPLGVFTASAEGISTARDVATGNEADAVTVKGLREAKYAIKAKYWPQLRWVGSRTFHKQVYGLSDGIGRPLFVESLKVGELDRVMGFPVYISEFAPGTFTTGQYVALLGAWQYYWIARGLDIDIQRLDELLARSNQIAFLARMKLDGMPVLEECFARVKLG